MSLFGSGGRKDEGRPAGVRHRTEPATPAADVAGDRGRGRTGVRESKGGGDDVASFGKSIVFKGDLSGEEDLEIEGRVEGQVKLPNHQLTIGAHGRVTAQVEAKNVIVVGHIAGNVIATERVEVQATGVVDADIHAPRLLIQEGAVVNGSIEMGGIEKQTETTPPAQPEPAPARKTG